MDSNTKSSSIITLDELITKISTFDIEIYSNDADIINIEESNKDKDSFFLKIGQYLFENVDNYDQVMEERVKRLLSTQNSSLREENKLELITIFSIIKTIKHVDTLLSMSLNMDSIRKINSLLTSFFALFKYHFQLPMDHNNYAFKNFGILLASSKTNVLNPIIKFMGFSTSSTFVELNKSETLEKTFALLLTFHCFNKDLFKFLINFLSNPSINNSIIQNFNLKVNKPTTTIPSLFTLFERFKITDLLEESTLIVDSKSNNLLNILFYSLFHKQFIIDFIQNISDFKTYFQNINILSDNLLNISNKLFLNPNIIDYLSIFIMNDISNLKMLDDFVKLEKHSIKERDISGFLLLKCFQNIITNYNLFDCSNNELLSYIVEYNNSNYTSISGLSDEISFPELNISTLIPLFEIINQNIKLNYLKERDFLTIFKLSLITLDLNLNSINDFMNLNSLLIDIGCSLSIHSLIDTIQTLLCIIINKIKFNHSIFIKIPIEYEKKLGFEFIPPIHRSDMSFENNLDLQRENFGTIFESLNDFENHPTLIESISKSLLEDSLTILLSVKFKIFKFLRLLNNETNVLRLPDLFNNENKTEEYPLHIFKQSISTKIASFKSNKALNYKLLNSSINLEIVSNLSLLILSENYKSLKCSNNSIDNSLSRLLNEFTIDFSLTFLLVYQEFGLLSFFKKLRDLNNVNLRMILPSTLLLSKLFQVKNTENTNNNNSNNHNNNSPTTNSCNSNFELISEILYKSVISSNLLRQYVELFDDGQSKPFKSLNKFLKIHPSTLKPSKISKGSVTLDLNDYKYVLAFH